MEQRTCIITGGNSGIGFDVAKRLVCHNYDVVLACRNGTKAANAVHQIKQKYPEVSISYMILDLSSKESVIKFVNEFKESKKKLQLLINNAGMWPTKKTPTQTADNLEETFQTNHLGPFYLTLLLLEGLKQNSPSRIIMVSSELHDPTTQFKGSGPDAHLDFENLMLNSKEGKFSGMLAYKNTKLANILFSKELSRRLPAKSGVTINSMNPGWIPMTGLIVASSCFKIFLGCCFGCCFTKTASLDSSSNCLVHLSCSDSLEGVTGNYYDQCREISSSSESNDENVALQLWDASVKLLDIENEKCVQDLSRS